MRKPLTISATVACLLAWRCAARRWRSNTTSIVTIAARFTPPKGATIRSSSSVAASSTPACGACRHIHPICDPAGLCVGDPVSTYQRSRYMDENLHQAFDPQPVSPLVLPLQFWP